MAWVKLDDNFPSHPKVVAIGPVAKLLFIDGLCYTARYLTDGFIPADAVKWLVDRDLLMELNQGHEVNPLSVADELVDAGLWELSGKGYAVHDYLDYNPTGEQVRAKRKATAERVRNWRDRQDTKGGDSGNATSNGVTSQPVTPLPDKCNAGGNTSPVPVPVPVPVPMSEESIIEEGTEKTPATPVADATPAPEHLPPEKPPRKRKTTPKTPPPPGVQVFRGNANRYPPKAWYSDIDATVGEQEADLKRWGQIVKAWIGMGWNPGNVTGMLDCYRRNEIPGSGNGPARASPGSTPLDRSLEALEKWAQEG